MEMQSGELLFYNRRTLSYNDLTARGRGRNGIQAKGGDTCKKNNTHALSYMNKHAIVDTVRTRAETHTNMHKIATTAAVCHMTTVRPPRETERESERIETRTPNPGVCLF